MVMKKFGGLSSTGERSFFHHGKCCLSFLPLFPLSSFFPLQTTYAKTPYTMVFNVFKSLLVLSVSQSVSPASVVKSNLNERSPS